MRVVRTMDSEIDFEAAIVAAHGLEGLGLLAVHLANTAHMHALWLGHQRACAYLLNVTATSGWAGPWIFM